MYRTFVVLCLIGILICLTPVFGVVWSSWFAERHDCVLNEAGRHPCIVNGEDWGGTIGGAFILGWLGLVTLPVGALILLALCIVTLIRVIRRARR